MTRCSGELPSRYSDVTIEAFVQRAVERFGPTVSVATPAGTWHVPRHFYALHGVKIAELSRLACRHGWAKAKSRVA